MQLSRHDVRRKGMTLLEEYLQVRRKAFDRSLRLTVLASPLKQLELCQTRLGLLQQALKLRHQLEVLPTVGGWVKDPQASKSVDRIENEVRSVEGQIERLERDLRRPA